jgi:hypothetical protein
MRATPAAPYLPFLRYKPETKQDKAKRLKSVAETVAAGKKADAGKKVQFSSRSTPQFALRLAFRYHLVLLPPPEF